MPPQRLFLPVEGFVTVTGVPGEGPIDIELAGVRLYEFDVETGFVNLEGDCIDVVDDTFTPQ